jgi:hypothetical protein
MRVFWELQERFFRWVEENPVRKERFWRRNLKQRAVGQPPNEMQARSD